MGSYSSSLSSTSAIDKRQVVSENGIGLSTDGSGNVTGLSPFSGLSNSILTLDESLRLSSNTSTNTNTNTSNSTKTNTSNSLTNSNNSLDGGAIKSAFDFANKSLSSVLALAINREKTSEAAANAVQDSAAASIAQIGQTAAQTVAAAEDKTTIYKKYAVFLALGLGAFWLWGKK